jgi:hypothetical protein
MSAGAEGDAKVISGEPENSELLARKGGVESSLVTQ